MSKTIYIQQLGRGMRLAPDKEYLMVFDFIDNANLFNMPYSLHRMFNISQYIPGEYVLASDKQRKFDRDLMRKGEKPSVYLDFPIDVMDYEIIDLFDWQEEVKDMLSEMEFVRRVNVQADTISIYIKDGKIQPDLVVPMTNNRKFNYFKRDTVLKYVKKFNWELITPANMKDKFIEMVDVMSMSRSYKPVLLKAIFENIDRKGRVRIEDLVDYFINYYEERRDKGLAVEKGRSLYKGDYTRREVERNIFSNPFRTFEEMNFMKRHKDLEFIEINKHIMKKLSQDEIKWIMDHSDRKLGEYFGEI